MYCISAKSSARERESCRFTVFNRPGGIAEAALLTPPDSLIISLTDAFPLNLQKLFKTSLLQKTVKAGEMKF